MRCLRINLAVTMLWLLAASSAAVAVVDDFDDGAIYQVNYPAWFKDSFLNSTRRCRRGTGGRQTGAVCFLQHAGLLLRHLFIETSLGDPEISDRLRAHFDSIGLEIFSDAELTDFAGEQTRVKTFALDQGVQFAPTILFFDSDGNRLLRLTGYYEPERFSQAVGLPDRWPPSATGPAGIPCRAGRARAGRGLTDDALFAEPPYALDRSRMPAQRPLLVLFEGAQCARCARFHGDVLGDTQIRERLAGFDVVRLDAGDAGTPVLTPAGERTNSKSWYAELGFTELPALVLFNESGEQVLATDALVLKSRMNNVIGFVTDRAYEQGWNYQRYARSQALKKAAAGAQ